MCQVTKGPVTKCLLYNNLLQDVHVHVPFNVIDHFQTLETIDEKGEIVSEQILSKIEEELMARLEELDTTTDTFLTTILEEEEKKEESEMKDAQTDERERDESTGEERNDTNKTGEKKDFDKTCFVTEGNKDESGGASIAQVIEKPDGQFY